MQAADAEPASGPAGEKSVIRYAVRPAFSRLDPQVLPLLKLKDSRTPWVNVQPPDLICFQALTLNPPEMRHWPIDGHARSN